MSAPRSARLRASLRRLHTLVVREARATLRDRFTMITLVAVPLVAQLAFGFVLSTEVRGMRIGIVDASGSPESRRLVADLAAGGQFAPIPFASRAEAEHALVAGELGAVLVLPAELARSLRGADRSVDPPVAQVLYDGAETILAGNAEAFLRGLVAQSGARLDSRVLDGTGGRRARAGPGPAGPGSVAVTAHALFNPRFDGVPFMVAGTFGFVLSFLTVLITAVAIVNERLSGTFDQLQLTPASNLEILLGKLIPLGAVFTLDVALMVLVAGFVLGVWPAGSLVLFFAVSTFYVTTTLSLGLIFSATSATAAEAVQKTVLFSVPLVQLSGFAFPIRNMPTPVQWLAELFPATHFIRFSRGVYLRGEGVVALWPELLVLGVFGALLVVVALRTLERRT
ncbi:MAG: ABC transporter permease [Deltaproteobacteria bacterium]|nr:ABC transporter permease [Deltaproteobacteria bacterium]